MEYNVEKQHEKGKLHAIERIRALCDENSFMEIYSGVRHNCTSFGMEKKDMPYDGVITGFGKINGRAEFCVHPWESGRWESLISYSSKRGAGRSPPWPHAET